MGSVLQGVLSFRHPEQRSKAERDSESPAPGWDFAPSPTWGRLEWGVSRKGFFSSLRLEAMRERMRTKPVRWKTMSFPTARIIQIRHGVPFTGTIKNHSAPCNPSIYATLNRVQSDKRSVIPGYDPESPASLEGFKIIQTLNKSSIYATLNQLCIQAHSSSLRCGGSLCKVQSDNISTPHSNSLPIGRENKMFFIIRSNMRP